MLPELNKDDTLNILRGFFNLIKTNRNIFLSVLFLVNHFLDKFEYEINQILNIPPETEKLKKIFKNAELKEFFFDISIMLVTINLNQEGNSLLKKYSDDFDYPSDKIKQKILDINEELKYYSPSEIYHLINDYIKGFIDYFDKDDTPVNSYYAMRKLFQITNGRFNDIIGFINRFFYPLSEIIPNKGLLISEINNNTIEKLYDDGLYIFEKRLSKEICDNLIDFALSSKCKNLDDVIFDKMPSKPESPLYTILTQNVLNNKDIQNIIIDESIRNIAEKYLGSKVYLSSVVMWWSTDFLDGSPSSKAAQLYHFDMDRTKFIKFFIYLTDVNTNNGPHCFIKSSHRRKPSKLLGDGRIQDIFMENFYKKENILEITAPQGTIFFEDTRGFHKGKPPLEGKRLVLQLEFSTDLFGNNYPEQIECKSKIQSILDEKTYEYFTKNKRVYSAFI